MLTLGLIYLNPPVRSPAKDPAARSASGQPSIYKYIIPGTTARNLTRSVLENPFLILLSIDDIPHVVQ